MVPYRRVRLKVSTAVATDWRSLEFVFSIGLGALGIQLRRLVFFLGLLVCCVWGKRESE